MSQSVQTLLGTQMADHPDRRLEDAIDSVLQLMLIQRKVVGAVVYLVQDGRLAYGRSGGLSDRKIGAQITPHHQFRLASLTKAITTVALLRLMERGTIGLDDPVVRWLPEFKPKLADGVEPLITIKHLMTHTAGLTYRFFESEDGPYHKLGISDGLDASDLTLDEQVSRISSAPLLFEPGTSWSYSVATDVLGAVIQRATEKPLPEAIRLLVTGPLEMQHTAFSANTSSKLTTPYADHHPEPVQIGADFRMPFGESFISFSANRAYDANAFPSAGAGMIGSVPDYIRLLEAIRLGDSVLSKESSSALVTNATGALPVPVAGAGFGWGLGVSVLTDPISASSPAATGTWGWAGVYGGHFWVDPVNRLSLVCLTNTTFAGMTGEFPTSLQRAIYSAV